MKNPPHRADERPASGEPLRAVTLAEGAHRRLSGKIIVSAAKGPPSERHKNRAIFLDEVDDYPTSTMTTR